jgi:hypothetical protein
LHKSSKVHHLEGNMSTRYLTISQTCDRIKRSRWTVNRLIAAGKLVSEKKGDAKNAPVYIDEASVADYLRDNRVPLADA